MRIIPYCILLISIINMLFTASCKPNEELNEDESLKKEQLGTLVIENNFSFNFKGEPIGFIKGGNQRQAYEWNPKDKSWHKLGNIIEGKGETAPSVVEDNDNNYYMVNNNQLYHINKTNNTWEIVEDWLKLNPKSPSGRTTLLSNTNGDLFIKTYGNANVNNYLLKKAGTSNWVEIKNFPKQLNILWTDPIFLTNKGYIYFQSQYVSLIPEMYNLNTNQLELVFDKTDQINFEVLRPTDYQGLGLYSFHIQPDGTIYYENYDVDKNSFVIYKFSSKSYPAKAEKVQIFAVSDKLNHGRDWSSSLTIPYVTPNGELKAYAACSDYYGSHLAEVYGKIGSNKDLKVYDHPININLGNHAMNIKGDVFVKYTKDSYLLRW